MEHVSSHASSSHTETNTEQSLVQNTGPRILSGIVVRDRMRAELTIRVSISPHHIRLVIIQVGTREDSSVYIKQKINFGASIGVDVIHVSLPEDCSEENVRSEIEKYNADREISGIIVQLPLPSHISPSVIDSLSPEKDVDCLSTYHRERLAQGDISSASATARAVMKLFSYYNIPLLGRHAVVVGRSALVGAPTALLLQSAGAKVSVIHRQTKLPQQISRTADVLVVACGVPQLVDSTWIDPRQGTVVIDVGIHRTETGLVGDVNVLSVQSCVSALSPVPGGVGPLTVACLFERLVETSS